MPRALNLLRDSLAYRKDAFNDGLRANGFSIADRIDRPTPEDVLVIWNRQHSGAEMANHFERHGARVIVCENGAFGKSWLGKTWFTVTLGHCAGAGKWNEGGPERWDALGVEPKPWRDGGKEIVIFAQRSIGEPGHASPPMWAEKVQRKIGGRIRTHPGKDLAKAVPLEHDLANAWCTVTWHSAAALQSLLLGVPVFYDHTFWIGAEAGVPLSAWGVGPKRSDIARLNAFRRAAWAVWNLEEIHSGEALGRLLAA